MSDEGRWRDKKERKILTPNLLVAPTMVFSFIETLFV